YSGNASTVTIKNTGDLLLDANLSRSIAISGASSSYFGNADDVKIESVGDITAMGGSVGIAIVGNSRTVYGNANAVTIKNTGDLAVTTRYAAGTNTGGIIANSYSRDGTADAVSVTSFGNISATVLSGGYYATSTFGIFGQSQGYESSGP